jgi:hypothetical protein
MSNGLADDLDTEYEDAYDDAEGYDDSEAYDDAESAASRARRRRARALAARRRVAARRAGPLPATAPPRAVVSAVKELDLQAQVQQDSLRDAIAAQNKKVDRTNLVTVGTLLIPEAFRVFGEPDNAFVRAGILASPLLLLSAGQKKRGLEGVIRHPAFYGGAGLLTLAFIGDQRKRNSSVQAVNVLGPAQLAVNKDDVFIADVLDARGKQSTTTPSWQSDNTAVAEIDATSGRVRAKGPGVAIITASAGDVIRRIRLEVIPATGTK